MKICVVQARAIKGDIAANIENHKRLIGVAAAHGADWIIFPELSITGYEPELADSLATDAGDSRFDVLQHTSDTSNAAIAFGVPIKTSAGICISLLVLQPYAPRRMVCKAYLHADEKAYFVPGPKFAGLLGGAAKIAPAICYEISISEHAECAAQQGAQIYVASVAKFVNGMEMASARLADIARHHAISVLMANCVGQADGGMCGGQSAVWNNQGELLGQLDDTNEGILVFDTATEEVAAITLHATHHKSY